MLLDTKDAFDNVIWTKQEFSTTDMPQSDHEGEDRDRVLKPATKHILLSTCVGRNL